MRKGWNEATDCVQPPGTGSSAPAEPRADKRGPGHVPTISDCVSAHYKLQLTAVTTLSGSLVSIQGSVPYPQDRSSSYIHCWVETDTTDRGPGNAHTFLCAVTMCSITMGSQDHSGWKNPLRSSSPSLNPALTHVPGASPTRF